MTHPYRERLDPSCVDLERDARLSASSVVFGLLCAVVAQALAGPGAAIAATVGGVLLLVARPAR